MQPYGGGSGHEISELHRRIKGLGAYSPTWVETSCRRLFDRSGEKRIIPIAGVEIASILLRDPDDIVQKGYGWMLKEASRLHQPEVFQFVLDHKREMPRTALRYAIELMPEEIRKTALLKDW